MRRHEGTERRCRGGSVDERRSRQWRVKRLARSPEATSAAVEVTADGDIWCHRWYHMSVTKTTIYLPDALKAEVEREARRRGIAEAEVIRTAIATALCRPAPRGALFAAAPFAERTDDLLAGFGER